MRFGDDLSPRPITHSGNDFQPVALINFMERVKMNTKSPAAVVALNARPNLASGANEHPPRDIEQARVAFLTRRLRIAPHLATNVAVLIFGAKP